jgi:hypothetical protein
MSSLNDDISSNVLRQMKAGGFDFTRSTPSSSMPSPTKQGPAGRPGSFVGNRSMPR